MNDVAFQPLDQKKKAKQQNAIMGSGASKQQILNEVKKRYAVNPSEASDIVDSCQQQIQMMRAKEYAKKRAAFAVPSQNELETSFHLMDFNRNGMISLAEIDKYIVERFPQFNNKPALMRAYKRADTNKSGWINKKEYKYLWVYIQEYNDRWADFCAIDKDGDRRISVDEFQSMAKKLFRRSLSKEESLRIFKSMDTNGGGMITFVEFCDYFVDETVNA